MSGPALEAAVGGRPVCSGCSSPSSPQRRAAITRCATARRGGSDKMAAAPAHVTQGPPPSSGVSAARARDALARAANNRAARRSLCVVAGGRDLARTRRRSPPEQSRAGAGGGETSRCRRRLRAGPALQSLATPPGALPSPAAGLRGVLAIAPGREGGGAVACALRSARAAGRAGGGAYIKDGPAAGGAQSGQRFVAEPAAPTAATSRPSGSPFLEAERDEPETYLSL